jgi:ABC-2 type transport system permease protein
MAELETDAVEVGTLPAWTAAQGREQLAAVAWLRWRIFVNSFRRQSKKRSVTGLVLIILLRIFGWFVVACFLVGPVVGCGLAAYYAPERLGVILWAIFSIHLFISINVLPGTAGFDLTALLRFPIRFSQYLAMRIFFGLFAIPTVVASLCLAATAVGVGVGRPALFPWAALVLGVFALHNVVFIRMIFAWVDRWMATRRAREIFGAIVLFASLGFQLAMTGSMRHRAEHFAVLLRLLAWIHPVAQYLPPSLAADAILDRAGSAVATAYARLFAIMAFALLFLAIFAVRLKREFRGENLSEAGRRPVRAGSRIRPAAAGSPERGEAVAASASTGQGIGALVPPTIAACLQKEMIYLKRSGAQLYGLVTPVFFIFIITRTNRTLGGSAMLLPYAVSYVMFGLLANLYNVLGAEGAGFHLYLLAPVRLRDVLLAKNMVNGSVIAVEILLALLAVSLSSGGLPAAGMLAATMLWAAFALLVNLTVGNVRSLLAPVRFEAGKPRRTPVAKGGALISLGVLLGTLATGIPVILLCRHFGHLWLATPIFLALDGVALFAYVSVLGLVDGMAANHREEIAEALCKT